MNNPPSSIPWKTTRDYILCKDVAGSEIGVIRPSQSYGVEQETSPSSACKQNSFGDAVRRRGQFVQTFCCETLLKCWQLLYFFLLAKY